MKKLLKNFKYLFKNVVANWRKRREWWVVEYKTEECCGFGISHISGTFNIYEPDREKAEKYVRNVVKKRIPEGIEASYTMRRPNLIEILFGQ